MSKYIQLARQAIDEKNNKIINHTPIGESCVLQYLNDKGVIVSYRTTVNSNERSDMMVKSKGIRFNEHDLMDLDSDSDDGFVGNDEINCDKKKS